MEGDKDDRKRRLVLRMKCLYTMAGSSLFSLLVVVCLIHFSTIDWGPQAFTGWLNEQMLKIITWFRVVKGWVKPEL